jgi:2-polyprenyl-6-methoxyphenol hydroxylase-like FAD-dependent oxidoreductase
MPPLKVLITGAGIAGNALAFWLSKLGHNVTVIERFPALRASGLQIDLRGPGIEVLHRMGLTEAYRTKIAPEQGTRFVDKHGRQRAYFPANTSGKGPQSFTTEYEIMRGDFCKILYEAARKQGAGFRFWTRVEGFAQDDAGVDVRFEDGKRERFDLLVGADGVGSKTRKMMLGSDTQDGFHALGRVYVAYFTVARPVQEGEGNLATLYIAPGGRGIMTRRHNPHELQVYIGGIAGADRFAIARRGNVQEEKDAITDIFKGSGWITDEILESMHDTQDFYCERLGLVKLEHWSHGRVVLVGDAAHCPSANTGMGTTSSMIGAYILAGEIGKHCKIAAGGDGVMDGLAVSLKAYEDKFQPFMDEITKGLVETGGRRDTLPTSPFGIAVMNRVLGFVSFLKIDITKWIFKENIPGWGLPDYPELSRG